MTQIALTWSRNPLVPRNLEFEVWRATSALDPADAAAVEAGAVFLEAVRAYAYRDTPPAVLIDYWYFLRARDGGGKVSDFFRVGPEQARPLPVGAGGTGGGNIESARTSLGLGALAVKSAVDLSTTDAVGLLPVTKGGTGAATQGAARAALDAAKREAGALTTLSGGDLPADTLRDKINELVAKLNAMNA